MGTEAVAENGMEDKEVGKRKKATAVTKNQRSGTIKKVDVPL